MVTVMARLKEIPASDSILARSLFGLDDVAIKSILLSGIATNMPTPVRRLLLQNRCEAPDSPGYCALLLNPAGRFAQSEEVALEISRKDRIWIGLCIALFWPITLGVKSSQAPRQRKGIL
jgi:hypothetical protein